MVKTESGAWNVVSKMFFSWFFRSTEGDSIRYGFPLLSNGQPHIASCYDFCVLPNGDVTEKAILDDDTFRAVVSTSYKRVDIVNCRYENGARMTNHRLCVVDAVVVRDKVLVTRYNSRRTMEPFAYNLHEIKWYTESEFISLMCLSEFLDAGVIFHVFNNDGLRHALDLPDLKASDLVFKQAVEKYLTHQKEGIAARSATENAEEQAEAMTIDMLLTNSISEDPIIIDSDEPRACDGS